MNPVLNPLGSMRNSTAQAAIALGSNLGDSAALIAEALARLGAVSEAVPSAVAPIEITARSPLYQTAPVGPPQPEFLNGCALLTTTLSPRQLLHQLLAIEMQMGRVRQRRWGPRLIDIDLILYGDQVVDTPELTLPHPRMHERAFVLVPLSDIAADWVHPILGLTASELVTRVDCSGVNIYTDSALATVDNG
ncbi:MAG: 2-amino-4-hydroxy-6-hydroxymethyldihydropteridine diphosphokinase [Cyanobacteria bacterium J06554_6]